MTRAKILTTAGLIHLTIATLFSLTFLVGRPVPAAGSGLGFTPTPTNTSTPTNTPTPTFTPVTPSPTPTLMPGLTPTATPVLPFPLPPPEPHLTITKRTDPLQVLPGGQVTFVIQVCNVGDVTANDVVVTDALPPELEVVSASTSQGTVTVEGNTVRAEPGSLAAGACAEVTIVAWVRADVAPGTQIANVAIADGQTDEEAVAVVGFLPEVGGSTPLAVVAGLLVLGVGLLVTGLVLGRRGR